MRALAIDFDDIEFAFAPIIEGFERSKEKKFNPTKFRAADAIHPEKIEGDTEGRVGVVGIMGAVAKLEFNHMKKSSLPSRASHGDNPGMPAPEGEVRKKAEVASCYEVKPFFEPHHGCHRFIIAQS